MESIRTQLHTPAWIAQTWASFIIALAAMVFGIWDLPVDNWVRGFIGVGQFFLIASTVTLATTIRDNHEAGRTIHRVEDAKTSHFISRSQTSPRRPDQSSIRSVF